MSTRLSWAKTSENLPMQQVEEKTGGGQFQENAKNPLHD
jgi:hypothetical protein